MSRYITAIDLGTTKVATIVGEKTSSGIKVIGYAEAPSYGIIKGEVVNIQKVVDAVRPTIEEAERQINVAPDVGYMTIRNVYVGITGTNTKCIDGELHKIRGSASDLITSEEIAAMSKEIAGSRVESGCQVIETIPQNYDVDDHIGCEEAEGMDGNEIEGHYKLIVGKSSSVNNTRKVIEERLHLSLKGLVFSPIAAAEAVLKDDEKELGVACIDIGGGTTGLTIYHNHKLRYATVIPFAGNSVSEDIRQYCNISIKNSEKIKCKHGTAISEYAQNKYITISDSNGNTTKRVDFKTLAAVIEARIGEILATVHYEIEGAGYKGRLGSGIVITGGTSLLNHIGPLAKKIIEEGSVRIAYPEYPVITQNSHTSAFRPVTATVVGLMVRGFELSKDTEEMQIRSTLPEDGTLFGDQEDTHISTQSGTSGKKRKEKKKVGFIRAIKDGFGTLFSEEDNDA